MYKSIGALVLPSDKGTHRLHRVMCGKDIVFGKICMKSM